MSTNQIIASIVGPFLNTIAVVYLWNKICDKKISAKRIFVFYVFGLLNNRFVSQKIKSITYFLFSLLIIKVSYKKSFSKSFIILIIQSLISIAAELTIVTILAFIFQNNLISFLYTGKGILLINTLVSIIIYIFVKIGLAKKIYVFLLGITNKLKNKKLILYTMLLIITLNVVSYYSYYSYEKGIVLILNSVGIIIYTIIIIYIFKTENKMTDIKNKYNFNLNTLKENEIILNQYKTNNHEHDNNLKTIRQMIEENDPKLLNFVNSLIKDNNKRQKRINEAININISGLNSLIHTKISTMKEYKIKYKLYISNNIKDINLDDDTLLDICKVIGVFLDNAIEEVKKDKIKNININIYQNKDLYIEISNTYESITFKSNKGKNRGYGLRLVDQIISENRRLENVKKITNNIFTQILIIKM